MQSKRDPELAIIAGLLICAALLILRTGSRLTELAKIARVERSRRLETEEQLKSRNGDLDGALEKIHELAERVDHLSD